MTRRLAIVLSLSVLSVALVLLLLRGATFETDILTIFPEELESVRHLKTATSEGAEEDWDFFLVSTQPGEVVQLPIAELAAQVRALDTVAAVEVTTDPPVPKHLLGAAILKRLSPEIFAEMVERFQPDSLQATLDDNLRKMRGPMWSGSSALVMDDPLGMRDFLLRETGGGRSMPGAAYVRVQLKPETRTDSDILATGQAIESLRGESGWLMGGRTAYHYQIATVLKQDLVLSSGFVLLAVSALFLLAYRSLSGMLVIFIVQLIAVAVALLVGLLCYNSLSIISISFGCVILGVGIDFGLLSYHAAVGNCPAHERRSIRRSIAMSAVTTIAAVLTLQLSAFPGIRQLSVLVGAGLAAAAVLFILLPPEWWSFGKKTLRGGRSPRLVNALSRKPALFMGGALLIAGGLGLSLLGRTVFDFSPEHLIPRELEAAQVDQWFAEQFRAGQSESMLRAKLSDPIRAENRQSWDPALTVRALELLRENGFTRPDSLSSVMLLRELDTWHATGLDYDRFSIAEAWEKLPVELSAAATHELVQIACLTLGAVTLALLIASRSVAVTGLILLTLVVGAPITAALASWLGGGITLFAVLALPLLFGLALDYAIHVALPVCMGQTEEGALAWVLPPLSLAAATSIIAFGALGFSSFPLLQNFGLTLASGIFAAFFTASCFTAGAGLLYQRARQKSTPSA